MLAAIFMVAILGQAPPTVAERFAHLTIAWHGIAQFADVATSEYHFGTGDFHEANPAMRWAAGTPLRMGIVKGIYAFGTTWLFIRYHKDHPKLVILASSASGLLTSIVVHRTLTADHRK
jgi:hypothetical protein